MSLYDHDLPKIKFPKFLVNKFIWLVIASILISSIFGFIAGSISGSLFYFMGKDYLSGLKNNISTPEKTVEYIPQTTQEEKIIQAVETVSPAVVSIVITKDLPIFEQYYINPFEGFFEEFQILQQRQKGTEKKEIGGGTGFIVSEDGLVLTNKHVVLDEDADYTVLTNDGNKFSAKVLARDPIQDLAILKIETEKNIDKNGNLVFKSFPIVRLGNSDSLQIGQSVIAIGNALGEFKNTVSVGVISGLGRTITASNGNSFVETIEDVIQTDAAINKGNSGGPILNLKGEVVGVNTAMVLDAQSISFAIPINKAKRDIQQIKSLGKIVYPFLGVQYVLITEKMQKENNLPVDYGAWVVAEKGEAVVAGSAAQIAGIQEKDIILEFNNEKITSENSLSKIIQKYNTGDKVILKILRDQAEKILEVILGERNE